MKTINKKNFFPILCITYTILSLSKIILEAFLMNLYGNYQENFILMFIISLFSILVLSQHYRLSRFPILLVMMGQYLLLLGLIFGYLWIENIFIEIHPNGYRDMFLSFTIPYFIASLLYYINVFKETKKANEMLQEIKSRKKGIDYGKEN